MRGLSLRAAGATAIAFLALCVASSIGAQTSDQPVRAPVNPAFEQYLARMGGVTYQVNAEDGPYFGLIPPPLDLAHSRGQRAFSQLRTLESFPASYDLRAQSPSRLTSVKNQGGCGSCWAFASYGSLESCLLPGQSYDLSENNLKNTHGFDLDCCDLYTGGGNHWMSTAYLARWSGPVLESSDPYSYPSCISPPDLPPLKHVQRVDFLPDRAGPLDVECVSCEPGERTRADCEDVCPRPGPQGGADTVTLTLSGGSWVLYDGISLKRAYLCSLAEDKLSALPVRKGSFDVPCRALGLATVLLER